jgi:hypothetical protein
MIIWTIFIALTIALVLLIPSFNSEQLTAKAQNDSSPKNPSSHDNTNNTRAVINVDNQTVTYIDKTTNKTISVEKFTLVPGNATSNKTVSTNNSLGNTQNATTKEPLTTNTQNATTNENLTTKFNALQGK